MKVLKHENIQLESEVTKEKKTKVKLGNQIYRVFKHFLNILTKHSN